MCIVQGVVKDISKTKIMVANVGDSRQMTIYQNSVDCDNPVAMILPFPNGSTCDLVDLSKYENVFDDLNEAIHYTPPDLFADSDTFGFSMFNGARSLAVRKVGSYNVSIVEHIQDFGRLNSSVFKLAPHIGTLLKGLYPDDFGYLVCIISKGAKYHPIAYTHQTTEGKLFVPTYHHHEHDEVVGTDSDVDWDHSIYMLNGALQESIPLFEAGAKTTWTYRYTKGADPQIAELKKLVSFEKLGLDEDFDVRSFEKIVIRKTYHGNHDLVISAI